MTGVLRLAGTTRSSFDALEPGGKILLHEMLLNDSGNGPYPANAFSLDGNRHDGATVHVTAVA